MELSLQHLGAIIHSLANRSGWRRLVVAKPPDKIFSWPECRSSNNESSHNGKMQTTIRSKSKIRKRFMNAHMKNGTSLRAIHNEIRCKLVFWRRGAQKGGEDLPRLGATAISWAQAVAGTFYRSLFIYFFRWKQRKNYDHKQDIGLRFYFSCLLVSCLLPINFVAAAADFSCFRGCRNEAVAVPDESGISIRAENKGILRRAFVCR